MKITCSRREDLIRDRDRYDAAQAEHKAIADRVYRNYRYAVADITDGVKAILEDKLAQFDVLEFDIDISQGWRDDAGLTARVRCNESRKFQEDVALAWNWKTEIEKGGVVKSETGSWSGLSATTPAQLKSLQQSVEAITILNNIDWKNLLTVELPKYEDYAKDIPKFALGKRPDYESQIKEAEIAELVGSNAIIQMNDGKYYRHSYAGVVSETPAMFTIFEISADQVNAILNTGSVNLYDFNVKDYVDITDIADLVALHAGDTYKVKKSNFISNLVTPYNIINY